MTGHRIGPTRVIVNMHVRDGVEGEFLDAWLAHAAACREQEGVRQFEVFRSLAFPENFLLAELWKDRSAFDRHFTDDHGRAARSQLLDFGIRRHGDDGLEIYPDQQLFAIEAGVPVPTRRPGWA